MTVHDATAPLVTVVIPAFNAAPTIRRAVNSVLRQTCDNYEIVVVDDGSHDATAEIIASEYGDQVRLLRLPGNRGESAATNEGIAAAKGELIAFLDADDEWLPDKLARQVALLQGNADTVAVSCGCRFLDSHGNVVREFGLPPPELDRQAAWQLLLARSFIAKPCVVARRSTLLEAGLFNTNLVIAEDQDMWIRLAMKGPIEFVPEFLTTVHDTAGSLTKVYANKSDRYVLPMIRRHIEQQRHRLSRAEIDRILGERYAAVGRNLYRAGSLARGSALIMRAAMMGYEVRENLCYLALASPPARVLKRAVGYSAGDAPASSRVAAPPGGTLLRPQREDLVVMPPGPPILIVVVDAEAEFDWNGPFLRTLVSVRNLRRQVMLQDIFDRLDVRPTFLVDYAVATQPEGYESIRDLLRSGRCEIGAHLQPWENPPFAEELGDDTSFNHNLPSWLQKEKLARLTDAITNAFEIKPIAYRAGRYGVGDEIAAILNSLGYRIDLSVLPGHDLRRRHGPDFRRTLNQPYWFGPERNLLEIPLTTGFSGLLAFSEQFAALSATFYTALCGPGGTKWHLPGVFARLGLLERMTLTPEGMSVRELKRLTRLLLQRGQRVFTFNYHSSSLLPGHTPYVRTEADLCRMIDTVGEFLQFFVEEVGGIFMTPMEFHASLQSKPAARSRILQELPAQ